jgi:signal transduction histidine kinase
MNSRGSPIPVAPARDRRTAIIPAIARERQACGVKRPSAHSAEGRNLASTATRVVSFAMVLVTLVAAGAIAYFTERGIVKGRDWVIHMYRVQSQLRELQIEIMRARADELNSLLTGDKGELPVSREEAQLATHTFDELRWLTKDNAVQHQRLDQLHSVLQKATSLIEHHPSSMGVVLPPQVRNEQGEIGDWEGKISTVVDAMEGEEESLLEQRLRAWNHLFRRNVLILGTAFGLLTLMLAYHFRKLVVEVARTKARERQVRDNAESYRAMSARILEMQDSERRLTARELHDSIGQFLAGLKINLNQLETQPRGDPRRLIQQTIELTDCALQEVRTLSHLLHPPLLEELGFVSAARGYLDEYGKRSQLRVSLEVEEPCERLPREIEIALFRVLQEALTNVSRHAGAQSVKVRIACRDGLVSLMVSDDGKGIPPEVLAKFQQGAAPGIGLAGMRERLAEFGGEITLEASPAGSLVQAIIPTAGHSRQRKRAV